METQEIPTAQEPAAETQQATKKMNLPKINIKAVVIIVGVAAIVAALLALKPYFIAASINGAPISRLSVIQELEKNSGKQALDALITKKLIETEATKQGIVVSKEDIDAEIKKIEDEVSKQGGTLEAALAQQGITAAQLQEQISLQKKLEKILADKVQVSDEEVNQYMTQNKVTIPKGANEDDFKNQIRVQLKNNKFNTEADKWITAIKESAKIKYFVDYGNPAPTPDAIDVQN